MGYNSAEIRIPLRLDNHLGPETYRDRQEALNLRTEIDALLKKPQYAKIAIIGASGP